MLGVIYVKTHRPVHQRTIMATLEESILQLVTSAGYRPTKPRGIVQQLKLPKDQFDEVKRTVKRMVRAKKIAFGPNHLVTPAGAKIAEKSQTPAKSPKKRLTGMFQRNAKGLWVRAPDRR